MMDLMSLWVLCGGCRNSPDFMKVCIAYNIWRENIVKCELIKYAVLTSFKFIAISLNLNSLM